MEKDLKRTCLTAQIIGVFFIANLGFFYLIVHLLGQNSNESQSMPNLPPAYLFNLILLAIFAAAFTGIQFLKKRILSREVYPQIQPLSRLMNIAIFNYITAEFAAILGLISYFMQKDLNPFLISLGISFILLIAFFPKQSKWEEAVSIG